MIVCFYSLQNLSFSNQPTIPQYLPVGSARIVSSNEQSVNINYYLIWTMEIPSHFCV